MEYMTQRWTMLKVDTIVGLTALLSDASSYIGKISKIARMYMIYMIAMLPCKVPPHST